MIGLGKLSKKVEIVRRHIILNFVVYSLYEFLQYAGSQTPTAVRSAIVQQLKLWAVAFKDQPKILEAYNMLEKTGNTKIQV